MKGCVKFFDEMIQKDCRICPDNKTVNVSKDECVDYVGEELIADCKTYFIK